MPTRPCIALLTDFGHRDAYVGAMKAVIAGICPDATLIDLCHDVPPQDITEGALLLAGSFHYLPSGSVILAVVDPGVGTNRLPIGISAGDYMFIGPDNGLLSRPAIAAAGETAPIVHELAAPMYRLDTVSATFHGRDIFAPAAAHLAAGVPLTEFGPRLTEWKQLDIPVPKMSDHGMLRGEVLHIDGFGNLITNISRADVERSNVVAASTEPGVHFRGARVAHISTTYGEGSVNSVIALFGSSGFLEIAVSGGSAKERFGARVGEHVTVVPSEEKG